MIEVEKHNLLNRILVNCVFLLAAIHGQLLVDYNGVKQNSLCKRVVQPMFIGRERELKKLNELYGTDKFQFPVIYDRRRVGKTALINEFVKQSQIKKSNKIDSNTSGYSKFARCDAFFIIIFLDETISS